MECTFLNAAGVTQFVRDDMLSGHWVQQEMNVSAEFPYKADKVIQIGMRMAFRDPATDTIEVFEVVNVQNREPDHAQTVTADHICIAELSDEHINTTEITNKTASEALSTALTGTLWSVGTNTASGAQNGDFSRGSVWDAVNTIKENWNVYITPRVVISSGVITGRYLDITPAEGVWRGLRLSIRKNMLDPVVTYDDTEVYTALYGYGGNVDKPRTGGNDQTEELTFADQVWTATSDHPAKPAGQTFLEWPEKTAIYGRNGRARFGYYQNSNIKDAAILLQKTWESLKQSCEPRVTVAGTCVDLYRLGYMGQPIRLHDIALVEIEETGELLHKQIVCNDVDLVNPDGTRPEIGDYIPNIIYINRETDKKSSGGGGGGRGRGSMTNLEDDETKAYTTFYNDGRKIGLIVGTKDGIDFIRGDQIILSINEDGGTTATIRADCIDIDGLVDALTAYNLTTETITTEGTATFNGEVTCNEGLTASDITSLAGVSAEYVSVPDGELQVGGESASWQTYQARHCSVTQSHYFLYAASSGSVQPVGTSTGRIVNAYTDETIHYLGKAST